MTANEKKAMQKKFSEDFLQAVQKAIYERKLSEKQKKEDLSYAKSHAVKLAKGIFEVLSEDSLKSESESESESDADEISMQVFLSMPEDTCVRMRLKLISMVQAQAEKRVKENEKKLHLNSLKPSDYKALKKMVDLINHAILPIQGMEKILYRETGMYTPKFVECPYCHQKMFFKEGSNFNVYVCGTEGCKTLVSCYPFSSLPKGIPANLQLRNLRKEVRRLAGKVFQGKMYQLFLFIEKMIGRKFHEADGHISSMTEEECKKIIHLFQFLSKRKEYLTGIKDIRRNNYLLEEYFISHATHQEMQMFYFLMCDMRVGEIAKKINMPFSEASILYANALSKGCPHLPKNVPVLKSYLSDQKIRQKLDECQHEDTDTFLYHIIRRGYFPSFQTLTLRTLVAFYQRNQLLKRLIEEDKQNQENGYISKISYL